MNEELAELETFFEKFSTKIKIYDPLDRQIPTDEQMEDNDIE